MVTSLDDGADLLKGVQYMDFESQSLLTFTCICFVTEIVKMKQVKHDMRISKQFTPQLQQLGGPNLL